jgi:RecA/RadA recombinase
MDIFTIEGLAEENLSKFDIESIVSEVQKLYNKDKKSQSMITTGAAVKQSYTEKDGVPLPEGNVIRELTGLPCVPYNKIIQVAGDSDVGKSTLSGEIMAYAQKSGHAVILEDTEDKFDAFRYDTHFGGTAKEVMLVKTNEILQGGEKVRKFVLAVKGKYPDAKILVVLDSIGGAQSRSHAERPLDDEKHGQPGQDAKENSQLMKMLVALINKYPDSLAVILVNQVYAKIGFMQHGNQESGGKKVKFHSSLIVQLKHIKTLTKTQNGMKVKYGILSKATITKNHLSQSENSIHQLDIEIKATGASVSRDQEEP